MIRARTAVVVLAAWSLGAATATGVGLLALSLVDGTIEDGSSQLLTGDPVGAPEPPPTNTPPEPSQSTRNQPTRSPGEPARTTASPSRSASPPRTLTSTGGSVVARCDGADAYLLYWTPAQGYRAEDVTRGPAEITRLSFAGRAGVTELTVRCTNGVPRLSTEVEHEREYGE